MQLRQVVLLVIICLSSHTYGAADAEPELPAGLGSEVGSDEPLLPPGLSISGREQGEPSLPAGLGETEAAPQSKGSEGLERRSIDLSGFAEARVGSRIGNDKNEKQKSILESRLQIQWEQQWLALTSRLTLDLLYDDVVDNRSVALESGRGWLDLREAYLLFRPFAKMDIKAGRQILTWGTGDLMFINDLFPKDWNAFFIGRDDEYLKAPSDALKVGVFGSRFNIEMIYTPRFDADRYIDGSRISFFNPNQGAVVGQHDNFHVDRPDQWFSEDEWSARLYTNRGSLELAIYAYQGYWKSPNGTDAKTGRFIFPRLEVGGVSLRGPVYRGIANLELGYYHSKDDSSGKSPFVRNSEWRMLLGYEQELMKNFSGSMQFYLEHKEDYRAYLESLPGGAAEADEDRFVWTLRLTRLLLNQNLVLSLFNFYSPTDKDGYARLKAQYKISDAWQVEWGANLFYGENQHTFFGQFEDNSNLYLSARYGF
ncbi:MAG: hypothetical protein R3E74_03570 [Pseudomonadales bacterium]|nr:hypothetical protein [Pseudomonadales bacterium]